LRPRYAIIPIPFLGGILSWLVRRLFRNYLQQVKSLNLPLKYSFGKRLLGGSQRPDIHSNSLSISSSNPIFHKEQNAILNTVGLETDTRAFLRGVPVTKSYFKDGGKGMEKGMTSSKTIN